MTAKRKFRLAALQRLRETRERGALVQLAAARREAAAREADLRADEDALTQASATATAATASTFATALEVRRLLAVQVAQRRHERDEALVRVDQELAAWLDERQGLRAIERLADRHRLAVQHADDRAERAEHDDIATGRAARQQSGGDL